MRRRPPALTVALSLYVTPVFGILPATVLTGEPLLTSGLIGGIMIVCGLNFVERRVARRTGGLPEWYLERGSR